MWTPKDDEFVKAAQELGFLTAEQTADCKTAYDTISSTGAKIALAKLVQDKGLLSKDNVKAVAGLLRQRGVHPNIGPYDVLTRLGTGGSGTVYKAVDTRDKRLVALKVLASALAAEPAQLQRFIRGAELAIKVDHPNVCKTYEVGHEGASYFLTMEFVQGTSLLEMAAGETRMEERRALEIIRQTAEGLSACHALGIVHRDVKPHNIIITPAGVAKIVDLGLAREAASSHLDVTMDGSVVGTPQYMSPEQCASAKDVDARADVYSLGATLYYALTGMPPFIGDNLYEVMRQQATGILPDPRALNPRVSAMAHALIFRMMAKDRRLRLQSMREAADALAAVQAAPVKRTMPLIVQSAPPSVKPTTESYAPAPPSGSADFASGTRKFKQEISAPDGRGKLSRGETRRRMISQHPGKIAAAALVLAALCALGVWIAIRPERRLGTQPEAGGAAPAVVQPGGAGTAVAVLPAAAGPKAPVAAPSRVPTAMIPIGAPIPALTVAVPKSPLAPSRPSMFTSAEFPAKVTKGDWSLECVAQVDEPSLIEAPMLNRQGAFAACWGSTGSFGPGRWKDVVFLLDVQAGKARRLAVLKDDESFFGSHFGGVDKDGNCYAMIRRRVATPNAQSTIELENYIAKISKDGKVEKAWDPAEHKVKGLSGLGGSFCVASDGTVTFNVRNMDTWELAPDGTARLLAVRRFVIARMDNGDLYVLGGEGVTRVRNNRYEPVVPLPAVAGIAPLISNDGDSILWPIRTNPASQNTSDCGFLLYRLGRLVTKIVAPEGSSTSTSIAAVDDEGNVFFTCNANSTNIWRRDAPSGKVEMVFSGKDYSASTGLTVSGVNFQEKGIGSDGALYLSFSRSNAIFRLKREGGRTAAATLPVDATAQSVSPTPPVRPYPMETATAGPVSISPAASGLRAELSEGWSVEPVAVVRNATALSPPILSRDGLLALIIAQKHGPTAEESGYAVLLFDTRARQGRCLTMFKGDEQKALAVGRTGLDNHGNCFVHVRFGDVMSSKCALVKVSNEGNVERIVEADAIFDCGSVTSEGAVAYWQYNDHILRKRLPNGPIVNTGIKTEHCEPYMADNGDIYFLPFESSWISRLAGTVVEPAFHGLYTDPSGMVVNGRSDALINCSGCELVLSRGGKVAARIETPRELTGVARNINSFAMDKDCNLSWARRSPCAIFRRDAQSGKTSSVKLPETPSPAQFVGFPATDWGSVLSKQCVDGAGSIYIAGVWQTDGRGNLVDSPGEGPYAEVVMLLKHP